MDKTLEIIEEMLRGATKTDDPTLFSVGYRAALHDLKWRVLKAAHVLDKETAKV